MEIKAIKEFTAEIFEISELNENTLPSNYQDPFFIFVDSRQDITVSFQFHTREDVHRNSGKPKYFDRNVNNAQEYKSYSHALAVANKFKKRDFGYEQKFYIVGKEQAEVVKIHNEISHKEMMISLDKIKSSNK